MVEHLVLKVNEFILATYQINNSTGDVIVLESNNSRKCSFHLIFTKVFLKNVRHCKLFVKEFLSWMSKADYDMLSVQHKDRRRLFIDESVYRMSLYKQILNGTSNFLNPRNVNICCKFSHENISIFRYCNINSRSVMMTTFIL